MIHDEVAVPITIMVVDDHPLLRKGIVELIATQDDMRVVAEAGGGREAVEQYAGHHPDVVLMDIVMPDMDGVDAIVKLRALYPAAKIIVFTTYSGDCRVMAAMHAGAAGFMLKNAICDELLQSIRNVHGGAREIQKGIAIEMALHLGSGKLTPREIQLLRQVADGLSNKRIARNLGIAEDTVNQHMKNILSKLNANDRTHAVTIALKRGVFFL